MKSIRKPLAAAMLALAGCVAVAFANNRQELKTLELATITVRAVTNLNLKGIPPAVLREAAGVAVIPHVIKAGLILDEKHGRGVVLVRQPDGHWSLPLFVQLRGHGVGLQAGIEATDLVLVFKTRRSLDRALRGNLALGTDASIAAGPLGHEVERATNSIFLKTDILSYSHSRGLFAGVALQGDVIHPDPQANEVFHGVRGGRPDDVLAHHGPIQPPVQVLWTELNRMGGAPIVVAPPPRR